MWILQRFGLLVQRLSPVLSKENLSRLININWHRANIIRDLDGQIGSLNVTNPIVLLIIANIYALDENYEAALKVLHSVDAASLLESSALAIQMYLKLDRHDLAKKELKRLTDTDEDAIITQLAMAWVYMATVNWSFKVFIFCLSNEWFEHNLLKIKGGKLQDAYFTFQEQADKNTPTSLLLNSQALCQINQGKYDEAQSILQEALDKVKFHQVCFRLKFFNILNLNCIG